MMQLQDRAALEQQILKQAEQNPEFRRNLLDDPRGTVQQLFGVTIPERIEVTVVEETPSTVYLVLPAASLPADGELPDQDLEAVAGGYTGYSECVTCYAQCSVLVCI